MAHGALPSRSWAKGPLPSWTRLGGLEFLGVEHLVVRQGQPHGVGADGRVIDQGGERRLLILQLAPDGAAARSRSAASARSLSFAAASMVMPFGGTGRTLSGRLSAGPSARTAKARRERAVRDRTRRTPRSSVRDRKSVREVASPEAVSSSTSPGARWARYTDRWCNPLFDGEMAHGEEQGPAASDPGFLPVVPRPELEAQGRRRRDRRGRPPGVVSRQRRELVATARPELGESGDRADLAGVTPARGIPLLLVEPGEPVRRAGRQPPHAGRRDLRPVVCQGWRELDEKLRNLSSVLLKLNGGIGPDILACGEVEQPGKGNVLLLLRDRLNQGIADPGLRDRNILWEKMGGGARSSTPS